MMTPPIKLVSIRLLLTVIVLLYYSPISESQPTSNPSKITALSQNDLSVAEIARQVTVRVLTDPAYGSGVIIAHQAQTYTVLTCQHVVTGNSTHYKILSSDGKIHPARLKSMAYSGVDLALIQFESEVSYQVAVIEKTNSLAVGDRLYASGFPNYHLINRSAIEETRNWSTKAFHLTIGKVALISNLALLGGYSLGYTNEIETGMSGGPVLNAQGQVVGINGRLKYPLKGIDAFTFTNGTKPSEQLFEQMETLSWAVPITVFQQLTRTR